MAPIVGETSEFGQLPPDPMQMPAPMPGMDPYAQPYLPGMPSTALPGVTPPPVPTTPAPAPVTMTPTYQPVAYPSQPGMMTPGLPTGMSSEQAAILQAQAEAATLGKKYFDEVAEKHSTLRAWAQRVAMRDNLSMWYGSNVGSFKELRDILLNVSCERFSAFYDYITRHFADLSFGPSELVSVVKKFILREKIVFPAVELYTRALRFIREVAMKEVPGREIYEAQKKAALARMFELSALELRQKTQYEEYKRYYDVEVLNNFALQHEMPMLTALAELNKTQEEKSRLQTEINTLTDKINATLTPMTDEEIARFIVSESGDTTLQAKLDKIRENDAERTAREEEFLARTRPLYAERGVIVGDRSTALSYLRSLKVKLAAGDYSVTPEIDAVNAKITALSNAQALVQSKIDAVDAERLAFVKSRPDLYLAQADGTYKIPTYAETLETAVKGYVESNPVVLISATKKLMETRASYADNLMNEKMREREANLQKMGILLNEYIRGRAAAEMKVYEDQMRTAERLYNEAAERQKAREALLQYLQNTVNTQMEAIGGVVGLWAYENKITEEAMGKPFFINSALASIIQSGVRGGRGMYEIRENMGDEGNFWKGAPTGSIALARDVLDRMAELERAQNDYETGGGRADRDLMQLQANRLNEMRPIYKMIVDRVNSPEFVTQCTREFHQRPEWKEQEAVNKALQAEFRNLYAWLEYKKERFSDLIDQLEEDSLELNGVNIPDVEFQTFEENEPLWYGVSDYLAKTQPRLGEVKKVLDEINARHLARAMQPGDEDHARIIQAIYLNVQAAQFIYRKLERMTEFQLKLKAEKERRAKENFNARS